MYLFADLSGHGVDGLAEGRHVTGGHAIVEAAHAGIGRKLAILRRRCGMVFRALRRQQVQHQQHHVLVAGEPVQSLGIEPGAAQLVVRTARAGVGDQHDVAGITSAPVDLVERGHDAGVGVLDEVPAGNIGGLQPLDCGEEAVGILALFQIDHHPAAVFQPLDRFRVVAKRDHAETHA